jgi:hypothetical protein
MHFHVKTVVLSGQFAIIVHSSSIMLGIHDIDNKLVKNDVISTTPIIPAS